MLARGIVIDITDKDTVGTEKGEPDDAKVKKRICVRGYGITVEICWYGGAVCEVLGHSQRQRQVSKMRELVTKFGIRTRKDHCMTTSRVMARASKTLINVTSFEEAAKKKKLRAIRPIVVAVEVKMRM